MEFMPKTHEYNVLKTYRFNKELCLRIKKLSDIYQVSQSEMVRKFIENGINEESKKNGLKI